MTLTAACVIVVLFFFFQAEDGIRDLVRSRVLGDVYKRQDHIEKLDDWLTVQLQQQQILPTAGAKQNTETVGTVSYTHLTLPTSDLV